MPMSEGRELPQINVRENDLPAIAGWKLNSEQYIICKVSVEGKEFIDILGGKKLIARIRFLGFHPLGDKPVDLKSFKRDEFKREKESFLEKANQRKENG